MGWGSGADLADELWLTVSKRLNPMDKVAVARTWVYLFEGMDCDQMLETLVGEVAGIEWDEENGSHWGDWYNK